MFSVHPYIVRHLLLISGFLFVPLMHIAGQTTLKGVVQSINGDGKTIPLSYSSIVLHNYQDTISYVKGTVSDEQGNYIFETLPEGLYLITVSYMGQGIKKDSIHIVKQVAIRTKNFLLEEKAYQLAEVIVEQNRSYQDRNKKVELFSPQQMKIAKDGLDLISQVPQLFLNPTTNTLQDRSGVSMTLLINGIAANSQELRNIPPNKIVRVEYYDIPPIRYSFTGSVVNVITKQLDSGSNAGVSLSHALTTKFANDNLNISHVWGNNQINLNYDLNWRNYKNNEQTHDYVFTLENTNHTYNERNKGRFDYITNNINLGYSYNIPDKITFQIKFTPFLQYGNSSFNSSYKITENELNNLRYGTRKENSRYFKPILGCYANIPFTPTKQLYIDAVGTLYNTKQSNSNKQYSSKDSQITLDNFLNANTHKKSLITEVMYQQEWNNNHSFNVGFKSDFSHSNANIRNILNEGNTYKYIIKSSQQYAYMQYEYSKNKFYISLAMEYYYRYSKNNEMKYHKSTFAPFMSIRYKANNHNNIAIRVRMYPDNPNISTMTQQANLEMENIISYGNPNIKSSQIQQYDLYYSFLNKYITYNLRSFVRHSRDIIAQYYETETFEGHPIMARKWENAPYHTMISNYIGISFYPLGNKKLSIGSSWNYEHSIYKSNYMAKAHHNYHGFFFTASYRTPKYGINAYYRIPGKYFTPLYISIDENNSGMDLYYNIGNWRIFSSWMFMFESSFYSRETQWNSPVQEHWTSTIKDNKNMITIGISWNFNKGKSFSVKKRLNNNDEDAGIL